MEMQAIGRVSSPFRSKFGAPRQAGLVEHEATIELDPRRVPLEALRGMEDASHLWVIYGFDVGASGPTVRPPRLGGNRRLGVLATRSPFRPNPIGLSAVRLLAIDGHALTVGGGDFVDGTEVLDLKPYVAWADAIPDARLAWAAEPPATLPVEFTSQAEGDLGSRPELRDLLVATLAQDPRPAYHDDADRTYGLALADIDVKFEISDGIVRVLALQ